MCYTVAFLERKAEEYAARYKKLLPAAVQKDKIPSQLPLFYLVSGFEHPQLPIVKSDGIFMYEWGLIPDWVKDENSAAEIQTKTLNAMGETAFEKPSFKKSIASQRCILGVSGFYEWRDKNKIKYPYFIHLKSNSIFSLGCIYEKWINRQTGEIRNTFSILTTPANPLMAKIHNLKKRMPLILAPQDEEKWINPLLTTQEVSNLIKPYQEEDMIAFTVSKNINNVKNVRNIPSSMEPVNYPELIENNLLF